MWICLGEGGDMERGTGCVKGTVTALSYFTQSWNPAQHINRSGSQNILITSKDAGYNSAWISPLLFPCIM